MRINQVTKILTLSLGLGFGAAPMVLAQGQGAGKVSPLDALLGKVKDDQYKEQKLNKQREQEFLGAREKQAQLLKDAKEALAAQEKRGNKIKERYDKNEKDLAALEDKLRMSMGTLGELFGVVKQIAGDTKGIFENSIISAELPGRVAFVDNLARRKELPNTTELRKLWFAIQQEMTEAGKVSTFETKVTSLEGQEAAAKVTRIGTFNLISNGHYLQYLPEVHKVVELGRQPQSRYLSMAEDFTGSQANMAALGVDPSRGTILSLLVQAPSLSERIQQGGLVGYVILGVLFVGVLITLERFFTLGRTSQKVRAQMKSAQIKEDNPLGQIMSIYENNKNKDLESLELKIDEAIMKSTGSLDRGIPTIKILAAVAPLLGLLGTVTGMIGTFQAITLFGTGDPKLMAGGISQALVTTVLGLVAAIPLVLLHSLVSGRSKSLHQILEEQSTGLIAQKAEAEGHS